MFNDVELLFQADFRRKDKYKPLDLHQQCRWTVKDREKRGKLINKAGTQRLMSESGCVAQRGDGHLTLPLSHKEIMQP